MMTIANSSLNILIFDNPYYTWDTSAGWYNEAISLESQLSSLGFTSVTRTSSAPTRDTAITPAQLAAELAGKDVFLLTARENFNHLEAYDFGSVLESFVAQGGTLIAFGGRYGSTDLQFINDTFGTTLTSGSVTANISITAAATDTDFSDNSATLEQHDFSTYIRNDSLTDEDAVSLYDGDYLSIADYGSAVTVLNYGAGEIVWLGWSYDKIGHPTASQDPVNWNQALLDAVNLGGYDFFPNLPVDDYGETPETAGTTQINGEVTGRIETSGDQDWFGVSLIEGHEYEIFV
ncbi:hypothetical protein, partial [Neptuniibacter sp.]|uniref:hypothetical protein n=1 Tax=Neptuniibacter sp. TaxID=1962643 RepID=UPI00263107BC